MADNTDIPYSPPQYIVSRSVLDREQLISEFESFKQSLHYISRAPEVVFERLIGNINEAILLRLNKQRAAQLAERQVLEKNNETLKEMAGNLESMTLREKDRFATQLAELQELVINNAALKKKVESLEKVEKVNAELEVKLKGLEAEVQALKAQLGGISDTPKAIDAQSGTTAAQRKNIPRQPKRLAPTSGTPLHFYFSPSGRSTIISRPPSGLAYNLTSLYQNGGTWLDLAYPEMDFKCLSGNWMTPDQETLPSLITETIQLTPPLAADVVVTVLVWLTGLDMSNAEPWRIRVYATCITPSSFQLNIEVLRTSVLYSAGVSWIAFNEGAKSGKLPASGEEGWKKRTSYSDLQVSCYLNGNPKTAILFNALEVRKAENLELRATIPSENYYGFSWEMTGDDDNLITCAANYLRLG